MSIKIITGSRIKKRREALGISADDFAFDIGFNPTSLWKIERGQSFPKPDRLIPIADGLGVSLDWLLGRTEHESGKGWHFEGLKGDQDEQKAQD